MTTKSVRIFGKSILLSSGEEDSYFNALVSLFESMTLPEHDIINLMLSACEEDSWMVDVGANIGYVSIIMSLIAPKGKVFSFEPAPGIYSYLAKNLKDNNLKNVAPHNIGLSDTKSTAKISYGSNFPAGAFLSKDYQLSGDGIVQEDIKLVPLDGVYQKLGIIKCDLLKVDVEGHELSFLKGAKNFIDKFQPTTIMEVNPWCLNVFNRISLPDFIEAILKTFPYIYAFQDNELLDLKDKDSRALFYHENVVNYRFQNVACGFNKNHLLKITTPLANKREVELNDLMKANLDLLAQNAELIERCTRLESAKSHQAAVKINKLLRR